MPKMSISRQIVSEIVAQLYSENSIQTLLIFFGSTQSSRGRDVYRHYRQPSGDFCQNRHFHQIASLQEATFGIEFKSPEADDFSPFSPLHAFLDISGDKRDKYKKIRRYVSIYFTINKFYSIQIQGKYWSELIHRFSES